MHTTDDLDRAERAAARERRAAHARYLDIARGDDLDPDLAPAPMSIMRRKRGASDYDLPARGWVNRRTEE